MSLLSAADGNSATCWNFKFINMSGGGKGENGLEKYDIKHKIHYCI